jgi:PAS domain S-box-containing protein
MRPRVWQRGRRRKQCAIMTVALCLLVAVAGGAQTTIRVGAYDNPPKVAIAPDGTVYGLYPDLLKAIADAEDWRIVYVPGTWTDSMDRLERGEIDIMVDVAYTEPRKALYAFNHETVLVNWGIVYSRPNLEVLSLTDLEGLRVAVMRGSTHTTDPGGILDLLQRFGIGATILEKESYEEVFAALQDGTADVGVVNRVFGLVFEEAFGVVRTPIVFNPIELRFAFPLDGELTPYLIQRIDAQIANLKLHSDSAYYRAIEQNLLESRTRETVFRLPAWMLPTLIAALAGIVLLSIAILLIRQQIKRRQEAEDALRQSEERFSLAMRGASDGLWDWDPAGGSIYFSPRWAEMLGYRADELPPSIETFHSLVHEDDRDAVLRTEKDYIEGRIDRYEAEFRLRHKDGHYVDILSRAFLVRDEATGKAVRLVGTHVDMTERKAAAKALEEREAFLRTIIEHMPVDFFAVDPSLRYIMQSPTSIEAIGDAVGRRADELAVPETLRSAWTQELRRVLAGSTERHEYEIPTTTGELRTYLSSMAPVYLDGEPVAAIGMSVDITDQKRSARELQIAKEQAEAADRLKSAFLATMSHELRTPLNSIIGFTGILLQGLPGPLNQEQKKQLSMVKRSAQHLLDLINDVLDISKIEAGQLEVFPAPFDLNELLRTAMATAAPLARAKGVEMKLALDCRVPEIVSDQRRVNQILNNLLSNAIKFTAQGAVTLRCSETHDAISIEVEDTGIGIAQEDLAKLFVPFQQIDTGLTRSYEGTGLGLSICLRLVEKLGGSIHVESALGEGSRFTVTLPKRGVGEVHD